MDPVADLDQDAPMALDENPMAPAADPVAPVAPAVQSLPVALADNSSGARNAADTTRRIREEFPDTFTVRNSDGSTTIVNRDSAPPPAKRARTNSNNNNNDCNGAGH